MNEARFSIEIVAGLTLPLCVASADWQRANFEKGVGS